MSIVSQQKDCLPCKLVSGFGLVGIGFYVAHQAKHFKPSLGKKIIYSIAYGFGSLGVARLLEFPPFSHKEDN